MFDTADLQELSIVLLAVDHEIHSRKPFMSVTFINYL